jgi:uncharacterized protein
MADAPTVDYEIEFPYTRSLGPALSAFLGGLQDQRIVGARAGDRVFVPPVEHDPATGAAIGDDYVDVGPGGVVTSWCWVSAPSIKHPLDRPFAFALVQLDGATTAMLHAVDAGSIDAMATGMRVSPRWKRERVGHITDLECFIPETN